MVLPGAAGLWFVGTALQAALGKDFCPKEKAFKAWKRLVSAKRLRSTYAKAYLSCFGVGYL
jgi:hypothetical protein